MNRHEKEFLSAQLKAGKTGEALRMKKTREKERQEALRADREAEKAGLLRDKRQFEVELESDILSPDQRMKAKQELEHIKKRLYQVNELLHHNTHTESMFNDQESLL